MYVMKVCEFVNKQIVDIIFQILNMDLEIYSS